MDHLIPLSEVAFMTNLTPQTIRLYRRNEKLLGFKERNRLYFTPNELNSAFDLGLFTPTDWYIGHEFNNFAPGQKHSAGVNLFLKEYKAFDGTIYIPDRLLRTDDTFRFVCARMYHYNDIIKRHRPNKSSCHFIVCVGKHLRKAEKFKEKMDLLYPGVVLISHISQVYRVKSKYYEQLKTPNYGDYPENACQERESETDE